MRTTKINCIIKDPRLVNKVKIVDVICDSSKIDRAKRPISFQIKLSKSKNWIRLCLAKFQLLAELNFGPDFVASAARLVFAELRQLFIEISIFHSFDSKFNIQFKIYTSRYVIHTILSQ